MYIAGLCHDLDHRGKNNAFMKTAATPLASIYTTSVDTYTLTHMQNTNRAGDGTSPLQSDSDDTAARRTQHIQEFLTGGVQMGMVHLVAEVD